MGYDERPEAMKCGAVAVKDGGYVALPFSGASHRLLEAWDSCGHCPPNRDAA